MPVRKPPTERQRRLGAELRTMREHIGMSINEAAALHRTDRTTVSNTESARSGVSFPHAETCLANHRTVLDRMRERALEPSGSLDFIRRVAQET
ncbi:helix-turn-helix domain-containing protein [Streptomyces thermoalcalitolerans]|uniref:HTH cro/C1-type domain-containing protein n=1 Tax=Streptomyces thermoalcalitolerans TaxID=65605 RepID=A0ABN1PAA2_9ACTN